MTVQQLPKKQLDGQIKVPLKNKKCEEDMSSSDDEVKSN